MLSNSYLRRHCVLQSSGTESYIEESCLHKLVSVEELEFDIWEAMVGFGINVSADENLQCAKIDFRRIKILLENCSYLFNIRTVGLRLARNGM